MKMLNALPAVFAGLLVVLTYLMVEGATPDARLHEQTLEAIRAAHFNNAALHRDLLRARSGLLRHYDAVVEDVRGLRAAAETLRTAAGLVGKVVAIEMREPADRLVAASREQEALVETFKSSNALLQNSVSYFGHIVQDADNADSTSPPGRETGGLGNAMLRFIGEPRPENAEQVRTELGRLPGATQSGPAAERAQALRAHAAIILARLPEIDDLVRRILGSSIDRQTQAVQEVYLRNYARAAARAGSFRLLLYAACVFLVAYLGYLFVCLRRNAATLQARLGFEKLIAAISTHFIDLPRHRLGDGIRAALSRLCKHMGVDQARILLCDGRYAERQYAWPGLAQPLAAEDLDRALAIMLSWDVGGYTRHECLHVLRVSNLPDGEAKTFLEERRIKSWLCVPLSRSGERLGFLTFEAVRGVRYWPDDDVALLRTAGEIFANALERHRTEAEREALEVRLHQGQRLEAIGTLAGGIAHEFNNILGAILGYAEVAMDALARGSRPWRHVEQVMRAGQRAQGVIDQILAFGRRNDRRYRPLRIAPIVEEALEFLRFSLPATVELRARLKADDAVVLGDRTQLQQVLINLCTNAAQSIEGSGRVDLELDTMSAPGERVLTHGTLTEGPYVRLSVRDTGRGIDAATMGRIFEPFFTTKPVGSGTGLGLSMVHGLVTQHGGGLNVLSRQGEGSTFEAYFPQSSEAAADGADGPAALARGNGETILIVDDEKPLVLLGEEMIAALGYEPVGFDEAGAAIDTFRREPQRFDLVLTDEVMPTLTGTELARRMREIRPDVPVVLMTGYGGPLPMHRVRAAGVREVIRKPLLSADIAACLARNLHRTEESAQQRPAGRRGAL